MVVSLHPLVIRPDEVDAEQLLGLWSYLEPPAGELLGFSPFGDWFIHREDDAVMRIDLLEGRIDQVSDSIESMQRRLRTAEGSDELLLEGLVEALALEGMRRETGGCFMYQIHPRLGGTFDRSNIILGDLAVWQMICAQLHPQIDAAPASAVFAGLDCDEAAALTIRWA